MTRSLIGRVFALLIGIALARPLAAQDAPPPEEDFGAQPPPADASPPARPPDRQTFEQDLAPYGRWVDTPEYGRVWIPGNVSAEWRPYSDGSWVPTDAGWSYSSNDPWGWACYHYGRWGFAADLGWFWTPGYVWSPAWVYWRRSNGYVAWSPLPPARYRSRAAWPGWVAVPERHFSHPIRRYVVPRNEVPRIVRSGRPSHPSEWAPLRGAYGRRARPVDRGRGRREHRR